MHVKAYFDRHCQIVFIPQQCVLHVYYPCVLRDVLYTNQSVYTHLSYIQILNDFSSFNLLTL